MWFLLRELPLHLSNGMIKYNTIAYFICLVFCGNFYVLFRVMFFIEGLGSYWSSSTVAIWYFEEGDPSHPIMKSIGRSFLQFGSIAFGSLLIAIVIFIRIMLEIITKQLKNSTMAMEEQAAPAKFALKCASCYIACFEKIIRFLTENAYIMMAISGENFCSSAK